MASSDEIPELPHRLSPVLVRRWLGAELERLRKRAGLTQAEAAKALGWGRGKVLYVESGERPISIADLEERVLPTYDVPRSRWKGYVEMAEAANRRGWWDAYDDEDLPRAWKHFIGIEQGARSIRTFEVVAVPGLLQTPGYAEAVMRAAGRGTRASESLERIVEVRHRRQEVLTGIEPLQLSVVLDENVLRRPAGGAATMRRQLEHVADTAERLPNVTVQVIEFAAGVHAAAYGSFSILDLAWPGDPGIVFLETGPTGATFHESRQDVYLHSEAFDRLLDVAAGPEESIGILRATARAYGT